MNASAANPSRFAIHNLDCASCAAKIEKGLLATEGVESAAIDFATLTLHLKARDMGSVHETLRRLDPGVRLSPMDTTERVTSPAEPEEGSQIRRKLSILGASTVFFIVLLATEGWMHANRMILPEYALALAAYLLAGWNVLAGALRTVRRGDFFDENVLMVIATVGAMAIHALSEAVGVMIFYKVGEILQERALSRSRRSVRALLAARPDHAVVERLSGLSHIPPEAVRVGEVILVKPGEKIPLDGTVLSGSSTVDTAPLTGEAAPVAVSMGAEVMAGTINLAAAIRIRVARPFRESSIARVLDLVENAAARKAATEKFITTLARYYTPAVVVAAAGVALIPPLLLPGATYTTWLYRALVILVISCPCALVVSIPLGYFGGIGRASRRGILVKGSNFIDALARVETVVFDKTGTLTEGLFALQQVEVRNGFDPQQLLALAAAAELHSTHPIGRSIVDAGERDGKKIDGSRVSGHALIPGCGVSAMVDGQQVVVGNDALLHRMEIPHDTCAIEGTAAFVVVDGVYAGHLLIGDRLRPEAAEAIAALRREGVAKILMLTGDNACAAEQVAGRLGLDGFHASLLPEEKVARFEQIAARASKGSKVAFVGDGINDAPVLARADVGIAMGALGSAAAIETADVVLVRDSPLKVAEAIAIARFTRRVVWQNIGCAIGVKLLFVGLGAIGLASMWEAVFADMGTTLVAVVNAARTLGKKG